MPKRKATKATPPVTHKFGVRTFSFVITVVTAISCAFLFNIYSNRYSEKDDSSESYVDRDSTIFSVRDLPGRGKGVIAIRDIKQGELIIQEYPLFLVPPKITESPTALIARLLQPLSPAERESFLNLSYVNFPAGLDPEDHPHEVALAIFQTNAVAAGDSVGIFPRMARLNHGCLGSFNVVYSWRQREEKLVVYAIRDIKAGQELLTTYTDTKRPMHQRRSYLQQQYGFTCDCSACSLTGNALESSDARMNTMSELYKTLASWSSDTISGTQAIESIQDIWELMRAEDYASERGRLAADATVVAASHSDPDATQHWAKVSSVWYSRELGGDAEEVQHMRIIESTPSAHRSWGTKKPMQVGNPPESYLVR